MLAWDQVTMASLPSSNGYGIDNNRPSFSFPLAKGERRQPEGDNCTPVSAGQIIVSLSSRRLRRCRLSGGKGAEV